MDSLKCIFKFDARIVSYIKINHRQLKKFLCELKYLFFLKLIRNGVTAIVRYFLSILCEQLLLVLPLRQILNTHMLWNAC